MSKIRITSALIILALITLQAQPATAADKGQTLLLKKSFSTQSGEILKLNGCAGNVKVSSWLKNEIEIKIYGSSEAGQYIDFNVSSDESGINICASKKAGIEKGKNLSLRYEITIPRDYSVKIHKGENVIIDDRSGSVEISTLGGRVR